MRIYFQFAAESDYERTLRLVNIILGEVTVKKADCLTRFVHLCAVLLKDEQLASDLEYDKKQMLLAVVASVFTWLRQLSN